MTLNFFLSGHELEHYLFGHNEITVEHECEADVFAVRFVGDKTMPVLRTLEFHSRARKTVHGPARARAIQVLEGKRESCGDN